MTCRIGETRNEASDEGFATRTVLVMVAEMVEARARIKRACVQFEALAAAHGVEVDWENTLT